MEDDDDTCSHTRYERNFYYEENWYTGEMEETEEYVEVSAEQDIDLHRYQCTLCGRIGYYSGVAKNFYEKGIKSDIPGLH